MWGYSNTFGLGYHEYLQWCEDMHAEPLFVVNCGMCHKEITPMPEMDKWVQDALDAIEYANGPATSKWGSLRARNGHPRPFNLKYSRSETRTEPTGPSAAPLHTRSDTSWSTTRSKRRTRKSCAWPITPFRTRWT